MPVRTHPASTHAKRATGRVHREDKVLALESTEQYSQYLQQRDGRLTHNDARQTPVAGSALEQRRTQTRGLPRARSPPCRGTDKPDSSLFVRLCVKTTPGGINSWWMSYRQELTRLMAQEGEQGATRRRQEKYYHSLYIKEYFNYCP